MEKRITLTPEVIKRINDAPEGGIITYDGLVLEQVLQLMKEYPTLNTSGSGWNALYEYLMLIRETDGDLTPPAGRG